MSEVWEKLLVFLPPGIINRLAENEEQIYDLLDSATSKIIGSYSLSENGRLIHFEIEEEPRAGNLSKEEIADIAEGFIRAIYPDQKEFELSAVLDLGNPYWAVYEKRDEKYGLFLHSTGFTVSVSTAGQVMRFHCSGEEYEVKYSEEAVSEKEALEKYLQGVKFELCIKHFDKEIFKNGDHLYHLAYEIIEPFTDLPIDGSDYNGIWAEPAADMAISSDEHSNETIYDLFGINQDYKLMETRENEGKRIEVWTKEDAGSFSFEMEEADHHVLKLSFEQKSGMLLSAVSGELHTGGGEEIGQEAARKKAVELMFKLYPDAHERFRLEVNIDEEEDEPENLEEEREETDLDGRDKDVLEQEPAYTFYFHLYYKGIRTGQHATVIEVGKFSGKVTHFHLDILPDELYRHLPIEPAISIQEAKNIYRNYVKMEKMFTRDYDETGKSVYSLSYTPSFPETVGHIRSIDAVTGKAMYVDVGDALFLD
ncbi:YcdB/YcdC domain-containing protein [Bacillus infantis]|uniref:YcdB/YcdC domain-containing protein n=1 Tax=Bacillus infantis TaxID=324767 RepID=UPI003CFB6954